MNAAPPGSGPVVEANPRLRAQAIKAAWRGGETPDVGAALRADPALETDKIVLQDLAYEAFRLRREAGEEIDPDDFCARFPTVRSALRRILNTDDVLSSAKESLPSAFWRALESMDRWPEAGERVGDYALVRELGRGAFAHVFLAREASTGNRPVVVKLSLGGEREAQTLGRLAHPNIVPIWSCRRDEATGLTIVCMPFLGGATLEDVFDRVYRDPGDRPRRAAQLLEAARSRSRPDDPPIPEGQSEPLLLQGPYAAGVLLLGARLAEALAFLHARQVCHRDLKPSNVLLGPDGCPRLLDFNLAVEPDAEKAFVGGTLHYAAPEHIRAMLRKPGTAPPDARSDLFSLGVILFELLTGRNPFGRLPRGFSSHELGEMLLQRQQAGCPLPQAHGLNPTAARLVGRCLAFDPSERPTAAELAAGLHAALGPGRLRRWAGRHRRAFCGLACLLLLVFGAAVAGFRQGSSEHPSPYEAGVQAFQKGDYDRAAQKFTKAIEANPHDVQSRMSRGLALLKAFARSGEVDGDKIDHAAWDFKEVVDREPNALARACLAYCLSCQGLHRQAVDCTAEDAKTGGATTAVLNNRACAFLQRGELDAAERALAAIVPQDRQLPQVRYNRALLAYMRRCQKTQPATVPAAALEDIDAFLREVKPVAWRPYEEAAQLYTYAAEDEGKRLADLSGDFTFAGILLARREQRKVQAIHYLRHALERGMDLPSLDGKRAAWHSLKGRFDFAALRAIAPPDVKPSRLADRPLRLINPACTPPVE